MKNIIIMASLTIFTVFTLVAQEQKSILESKLNLKFANEVDSNDYLPKNVTAHYKNVTIKYFSKNLLDYKTDVDDWYSSAELKNYYDSLKQKNISYGFGKDPLITKKNDTIFVDYIVISMFEVSDFRLERFFLIFKNNKVAIFQITPNTNIAKYKDELTLEKYFVHRNDNNNQELIWDYKNKKQEEYIKKLRKSELQNSEINDWYKNCEKIKKMIE